MEDEPSSARWSVHGTREWKRGGGSGSTVSRIRGMPRSRLRPAIRSSRWSNVSSRTTRSSSQSRRDRFISDQNGTAPVDFAHQSLRVTLRRWKKRRNPETIKTKPLQHNGVAGAFSSNRSAHLLEKRPSISLQPLVLVIQDSRFLSRSLCSVKPTVRHGLLAPSIPLGASCLSIGTGCSCVDSTGEPKIFAAMRRHISIPL